MNGEEDHSKLVFDISSKKNELENYLKKLDKFIYDAESKYLENTSSCGNVVKGWDQIFTAKSKLGGGLSNIKKTKFTNNERIFSQTSYNNHSLREDGIGNPPALRQLGHHHSSSILSKHSHNNGLSRSRKKILSLKKKNGNGIMSERNLQND